MALLGFLRRLYSLDTLDTRFTSSSNTPPKQLAAEPAIDPAKPAPNEAKDARAAGSQPSKWGTPEFYLYYLVFLAAVPSMFYVVYDVSKGAAVSFPEIWPPTLTSSSFPSQLPQN